MRQEPGQETAGLSLYVLLGTGGHGSAGDYRVRLVFEETA